MRPRHLHQGRRPRSSERGQALLETAIVMPIMIFLILGALQLMMIEHGKVMTKYAAYNAARAGIVNDANWNVMRNAALVSVLPLYQRTDTLGNFLIAWGKMKLIAEATQAVDTGVATVEQVMGDLLGGVDLSGIMQSFSLIEVNVTSPKASEFDKADKWQQAQEANAISRDNKGRLAYPSGEIDFDDPEMLMSSQAGPRLDRLAVQVRVLCPMRIPIVNWIIFQVWYAQAALRVQTIKSTLQEWSRFQAHTGTGQNLEHYVESMQGQGPFDNLLTTTKWMREMRTLHWLAVKKHIYLLPLHASYAMQMQSNPFKKNRREPAFFSINP